MICLGIESTAHTFGVGIIDDKGTILADAKDSYTTAEGGMVPSDVAQHHERVADRVIKQALADAKLELKDIDVIAFAHGPGIAPCLLVGLNHAKKLAKQHNAKLVGVNHCVAHLTIGDLLCKSKDPVYLYVSGVNTQVIARAGNYFRIFGETVDIGLGNAFDKFGRIAGLGFPAGPKIERLAKKGKYVELPYAVKGMDVSFAGMITKAERLLEETPVEDVCFSLQETAFAMIAEVAERAMAHCEKDELVLIGGVAANKRLVEMLGIMCRERSANFCAVPIEYAGDQGVMIAWQGFLQKNQAVSREDADIKPYERTDDVRISWK